MKKLDVFAKPINLKISGEKEHTTFIGAFFTFVWLGIIVAIAIYEMLQLTEYKNPLVSREPVSTDTYASVDIGKQGFLPLLLAYSGTNTPLTSVEMPKYFTAYIQQTTVNTSFSDGKLKLHRSVEVFPMTVCGELNGTKKSAYSYISEDNFLYKALPQYGLCPPVNNQSLIIAGKSTDSIFQTVSLLIKPCTLASGCATISELADISFQLMIPASSVDMQDNKKPHRYFLDADSTVRLNPAVRQHYSATVGEGEVREFTGWIPKWVTRNYYEVRDVAINVGFRDSTELSCTLLTAEIDESSACPSYFEYSLQSSGLRITNNRKYSSILDVLASIGGIQSTVALVIALIYTPINKHYRTKYLVQKVYPLLWDERKTKEIFEAKKKQRAEEKKRLLAEMEGGNMPDGEYKPYVPQVQTQIAFPYVGSVNPRDLVSREAPVSYDPGVTRLNPPGTVEVLHKDREGPGIDVLEIRTPIEVPVERIDEQGRKYFEYVVEWVTEVRIINRHIGQEVQSPMKGDDNKLAEEDRTPKGQMMTEASPENEPLNIKREPQRGSAIGPIPTRAVEEGDNDEDDSDDDGCFPEKLRCCCC